MKNYYDLLQNKASEISKPYILHPEIFFEYSVLPIVIINKLLITIENYWGGMFEIENEDRFSHKSISLVVNTLINENIEDIFKNYILENKEPFINDSFFQYLKHLKNEIVELVDTNGFPEYCSLTGCILDAPIECIASINEGVINIVLNINKGCKLTQEEWNWLKIVADTQGVEVLKDLFDYFNNTHY